MDRITYVILFEPWKIQSQRWSKRRGRMYTKE
jgi:hypothetical protein